MSSNFELKHIYACSPATVRGQPTHLGDDKKHKKNFLYCCGKLIVIRNMENPLETDLYLDHQYDTTCARYSPSGFYIASADCQGNVRIWDTVNKEHVLKIELRPLSGPIFDLQWSEDSKRIVCVGEGKEQFASAFIFDSGATVGDITGHSKNIISCDFKQKRPYRIATGGEDNLVNFYAGPPFKYQHSNKDHTRFVNCVRFSPDGERFVSVSSDGKGFIFDGKTGEKTGELSSTDAHTGAIYSCAWSPDSKKLLTASADKTAKIWDMDTFACEKTFTFAEKPTIEDIQVGSLWQQDNIITLSLSGNLNYLDMENPSAPKKILRGHNKYITSMAYDASTNTAYTGSYDGHIRSWEIGVGCGAHIEGKAHSNEVSDMKIQDGKLITCSMDDTISFTDLAEKKFGAQTVACESTPKSAAVGADGLVVVACLRHLLVLNNGAIVHSLPVSYSPACIALSTDGAEVSVGGEDHAIYRYTLEGQSFKPLDTLARHRGPVTCVQYSPDGAFLASACRQRDIFVWDLATKAVKIEGWCFHTARVDCLQWAPNSRHIATGGLDSNAFVWSVEAPKTRIQIKNCNQGGVNAVAWIDNATLATAGKDCCVKTWALTYSE